MLAGFLEKILYQTGSPHRFFTKILYDPVQDLLAPRDERSIFSVAIACCWYVLDTKLITGDAGDKVNTVATYSKIEILSSENEWLWSDRASSLGRLIHIRGELDHRRCGWRCYSRRPLYRVVGAVIAAVLALYRL